MPTTPPAFTATPVIPGAGAADMPTALGPGGIGANADANFALLTSYASALESTDFRAVEIAPVSGVITATANHSVASTDNHFYRRGNLTIVRAAIGRISGAALVSGATGVITLVNVATLAAGYRPPYEVYMVGRCYRGPFFSMFIKPDGSIGIRGSSQINYTYATTWTADFEARWIA